WSGVLPSVDRCRRLRPTPQQSYGSVLAEHVGIAREICLRVRIGPGRSLCGSMGLYHNPKR
ncbi:MAG: hypothetical protein NTU79_21505, partial [Planctomycetota bacterium]|nr:hypothetical protein [Planctomycetota bacterium]